MAERLGVAPFASVQNHYSLLRRDPETDGLLAACERHGVALKPEQAGKFIDDERLQTVATLTEWAEGRGHSILDLAMSWLAVNQQVASVICGATAPAQVFANVVAATWSLGPRRPCITRRGAG